MRLSEDSLDHMLRSLPISDLSRLPAQDRLGQRPVPKIRRPRPGGQAVRGLDFTSYSGSDYAWQHLFTTRRRDPATGLMHYRNRDYHPQLGRFVCRNPMGYKSGINLYEYVGDHPTIGIDPLGLDGNPLTRTGNVSPLNPALQAIDAVLILSHGTTRTHAEVPYAMFRESCKANCAALSCCLVVASVVSYNDKAALAEDGNTSMSSERGTRMNTVRILSEFEVQGYGLAYVTTDEIHRSPYMLVARIYRSLTNEKMPPLTLEGILSNQPPENKGHPSGPPRLSPTIVPETYRVYPVAWSLKIVNLNTSFLPQLREEVIVLVEFIPKFFEKGDFRDGPWLLACLRHRSQYHSQYQAGKHNAFDYESLWEISSSPELVSPGASQVRYCPNITRYKSRPTLEQVADFVKSTDFGNNDVYGHTSVSTLMDVEVVQVAIYPDYAQCLELFQNGLPPAVIEQRKTAYEQSFKNSTLRRVP